MFLEIIQRLLEERGITKVELARESGVPYTTIDGWYKKGFNGVRLDTLKKLSVFFGVSIDFLVTGIDEKPTDEEHLLLSKYRKLDSHGRRVVDLILYEEYSRVETTII